MSSPRLRTIPDLGDLSGKRVLVRCDFNVPLEDGRITDDLRIKATKPTLEALLDRGSALVLCSHVGRPKGRVVEDERLDPVARRLLWDLLFHLAQQGTTLFVTTASVELVEGRWRFMDEAGFAAAPMAGGIFAIDVGVRGLPEPAFRMARRR